MRPAPWHAEVKPLMEAYPMLTQCHVALIYNVSKTTIWFVLNPEKKRQRAMDYYNNNKERCGRLQKAARQRRLMKEYGSAKADR